MAIKKGAAWAAAVARQKEAARRRGVKLPPPVDLKALYDAGFRAAPKPSPGIKKGAAWAAAVKRQEAAKASLGPQARKLQAFATAAAVPTDSGVAPASDDARIEAMRLLIQSQASPDTQLEALRAILSNERAMKPRLHAIQRSGAGVSGAAAATILTVSPTLKKISGMLQHAADQTEATSEHHLINNQIAFRKATLSKLVHLSTCLPKRHPLRDKLRRIGLFSGLI